MEEKKFDSFKYINDYKRENYKRKEILIKKSDWEKLEKILKENDETFPKIIKKMLDQYIKENSK